MAKSLIEQFQYTGGYVDTILGPYDDLTSLKSINSDFRFEGLTVVIKSPVQMECWLVGGTANSYWRIKSLFPLNTYADLVAATEEIQASFVKMVNVGTEATVLEDETNDGKLTKYWATAVDTKAKTVTWERMTGGAEGDYVPTDCITGADLEK